ncbi:ACP S-malonyltransferase [Candidatus Thiomargarita nelsonii]|uniref:ACP S-malonyltransferase n=1 Tax=Candidatus Thiomargarita nelsonii TaxID=1003181 RepID=A0A0A6PMQ8_9GAMM|nr:ACP S-malonyltransferase [Candidatus Thiomargarita nelsonii]
MTILSDHNIEGQAKLLWGTLGAEGWLSLISLELVTFQEVGLPIDSNDREVWRFAQANNLILLTTNRNMEDENSLEQTMLEENTMTSLPVLTIGNQEQILYDTSYRQRCAERLVDVLLDLENYLGTRRVFIP